MIIIRLNLESWRRNKRNIQGQEEDISNKWDNLCSQCQHNKNLLGPNKGWFRDLEPVEKENK